MKPAVQVPPVSAAALPEGWIAERREILVRNGQACRAGAGASIEVKSLTTNEWHPLTLPGGALHFATAAERDAVLAGLVGGNSADQPRAQRE